MYDRLRYEIRLMGKKVFFAPALVLIAGGCFAILLLSIKDPAARFLSAVLEMLLPLATGASVAFLTASDPALELQLTMPHTYAVTVPIRLLLLLLWNSCLAFIASSIIFMVSLVFLPQPHPPTALGVFFASQLVWFPSLLACTAFGFGAALLFQSRAASVGLLAGCWVVEIVFKDVIIQQFWFFPLVLFSTTLFPDGLSFSLWQLNRLLVLGVGVVLLLVSWPCLLFPERLLKGSHQE
ncbi:hypothetical protein [Dictyobacter arantiisoli]|uniref:Uncharacterized protein n=1 Tax=Dictyobacter arantiisoli TaxID=2014874 RepID=A0A5A5T6H2_9CHLR|nr:hypothetical protein [Dictyobacter arantiisoli]GCF06982.1 hypothetical protein KDI_05460 [Dictyobacter arantiisoli]